jgi:hypothetical protein
MKKIFLSGLTSTLFALTLLSTPARAEGGYAAALVGPSFVNNNVGTRLALGGHFGTKVHPYFGLGMYGVYESLGSIQGNNGSISQNETVLAAEFNFFPLLGSPFYFGAKLGVGFTSQNVTIGSGSTILTGGGTSSTDLAIGPALGFQFFMTPTVTLGAEFNSVWVMTPSTLNLTNLLGMIGFWF